MCCCRRSRTSPRPQAAIGSIAAKKTMTMPLHSNRDAADRIAERVKVFGQGQRLMILATLREGEHSVGEIEEMTGIGQPVLSQRLAELRRADLVKTRRESRQIYYRFADDKVLLYLEAIEAMFNDGAPALLGRSLQIAKPAKKTEAGAVLFAEIEQK
ncbi:MAG: ArsR/SmtB family transcription factor [Methylovirgula sp.]